MKYKKIKTCFVFLGIGLTAQAQQLTTATGGDNTGSGGSVSYSVGQIVYTTNVGTTGAVGQGVQSPFEISIVSGIENPSISLELAAFPNPTTNFLTLKTGNAKSSALSFQLFDISGKLIETRKILSSTETIHMERLPSAIYLLKVINNNNKEEKTFKIIKH